MHFPIKRGDSRGLTRERHRDDGERESGADRRRRPSQQMRRGGGVQPATFRIERQSEALVRTLGDFRVPRYDAGLAESVEQRYKSRSWDEQQPYR